MDAGKDIIKIYKTNQFRGRFSTDIVPEKAHLICVSVGSVGNVAMAMNSLYFCGYNCKEIYIDFSKKTLTNWTGKNPYDKIFDQHLTDTYEKVSCWGNMLFDWDEIVLADIRNKVQSYFKFNDYTNGLVDNFVKLNNISEKTLGVHIRMSDMNSWHGTQFGFVYYDDYIREIDRILHDNDIDNLFISSDNKETLNKLKIRYSNAIYYTDVFRTDNEHEYGDHKKLMDDFFYRMRDWDVFYTPFLDMITLSKCGYFIGRKFSNFSIAAIMLGNMKFKNIVNLS